MVRTLVVSVADEVWIATALLHWENPERADFTLSEIVARAHQEQVVPDHRDGLRPHASRHCVANVPPSPARLRMLLETGKSTRRLYKPGDPVHPARREGRAVPKRQDIPADYHFLLDWYEREWTGGREGANPFRAMKGAWKELLRGKPADVYVRELREGWE
jgi:hypothetical protein